MLDDGEVERRVRLIRPVDRLTLSETALARSQWRETDAGTFANVWEAELAAVPAYTESTFHIVTGLLLPIWTRLPDESCRVYRLQTDDGERVIGRLVSPAALDGVCRNLGVEGAPALSVMEAWDAVVDGSATLHLASGLQVRRVSVMGAPRVELVGFTDGAVESLKALGCISEIIAWTLRLFVPAGERGPVILGSVLDRHPLVRVAGGKPSASHRFASV